MHATRYSERCAVDIRLLNVVSERNMRANCVLFMSVCSVVIMALVIISYYRIRSYSNGVLTVFTF